MTQQNLLNMLFVKIVFLRFSVNIRNCLRAHQEFPKIKCFNDFVKENFLHFFRFYNPCKKLSNIISVTSLRFLQPLSSLQALRELTLLELPKQIAGLKGCMDRHGIKQLQI